MFRGFFSLVAIVFVCTANLQAQSVIGPFTGNATEDFESFPQQSQQIFVPNPTPVFGGHGVLTVSGPDDAVKAIAIYTPSAGSGFGSYLPSDGIQYAVSQNFDDSLSFALDAPATMFGGYWGQAMEDGSSVGVPLNFTFYSALDVVVGSGAFVPDGENDSSLTWLGLQNTTPFVRVDISPGQPALILMDGLQTDAPEPASMSLLIGGAAMMFRRRRAR